ncbi:MAG: winged helix-turn-helix domain-containing protein [Pseudobdellovibrio sp.]
MNADRLYELSKLYCDRGDYNLALPNLIETSEAYLVEKNFDMYLKCATHILRIYAEQEEYERLSAYKEKLQDIVIRENIQLTSRVYYVFGIAAVYKGQIDNGLEYFKIALEHALKTDNKEDTCYAILGISICYRHQKRYEEALKEIYNLNIFTQFIDNPDLKTSILASNGSILEDLKKFDQALEVFWQAYEITKKTKQITVANGILAHIGICLFETGQKDAAKIYFDLVSKSLDKANNKKLLSHINGYLGSYKLDNSESFDITCDFENHIVKEKQMGVVDFKNQFILLDLLKLFISRQGEVFSKEYLVEHIWKQEYDPAVHDNKIYVTIKRLRKMIEPDYDRPKYIFRSKNGYFLNKSIKVNDHVTQEGRV